MTEQNDKEHTIFYLRSFDNQIFPMKLEFHNVPVSTDTPIPRTAAEQIEWDEREKQRELDRVRLEEERQAKIKKMKANARRTPYRCPDCGKNLKKSEKTLCPRCGFEPTVEYAEATARQVTEYEHMASFGENFPDWMVGWYEMKVKFAFNRLIHHPEREMWDFRIELEHWEGQYDIASLELYDTDGKLYDTLVSVKHG